MGFCGGRFSRIWRRKDEKKDSGELNGVAKESVLDTDGRAEENKPKQIGKSKQEIALCITSGGGECDHCESVNKCIKMKRMFKRAGMNV